MTKNPPLSSHGAKFSHVIARSHSREGRRGDLILLSVILSAARNLLFAPPPRLPRGVYPELGHILRQAQNERNEGLAMT